MTKLSADEINRLIDEKIRQHEIRVTLTSGAIGAALFLGIFHAIGLLNHDLRP
jgi:hypothetical protein